MAFNEATLPNGEAPSEHQRRVYSLICDEFMPRMVEQDRPFVVGVNGVDTSGKTEFARGLEGVLVGQGIHVQTVHMDDFSNPRAVRNTTSQPAHNYYQHCFDLDCLVGQLLHPAREAGQLSTTINHIDLATDERLLIRQYEASPGSVLLLEGVFIFRPEIAPYLDYGIFLDIPLDAMLQRAAERDVPRFGETVLGKYRDKYIPAQERYLQDVDPASMANVVVDNRDWRRPVIVQANTKEQNMSNEFFHECEVKYRIAGQAERSAVEGRIKDLGFTYEGAHRETDFLPDTSDFLCRQHGILLRFRRILGDGQREILLTLKVKGEASDFQEYYELQYPFSQVDTEVFDHINEILGAATRMTLPPSIHDHDAEHYGELINQVKAIFPAHRILLEKKRAIYARGDIHILLDTLPEGIGDYLEIEAPSPERLRAVAQEVALDPQLIEPLDYGDILKRHKAGRPEQEARTGLFQD